MEKGNVEAMLTASHSLRTRSEAPGLKQTKDTFSYRLLKSLQDAVESKGVNLLKKKKK